MDKKEVSLLDRIESGASLVNGGAIQEAFSNLKDAVVYGKKSEGWDFSKRKLKMAVDFGKNLLNTFVVKTEEQKDWIDSLSEVLNECIEKSNRPRY